ncbi:hypothetical protein [Candidatus Tisiphia endosymbiont of Sialis lutaria]|uniref:hypothetical protein n=1 Tax=Candidatus Tisiphia endosymbiont of Sialis lutaria TaxID=2029164 RepID=UPI00312CA155
MEINRTLKQINIICPEIDDNAVMELLKIVESNKIVSKITIEFINLGNEKTSYEVEELLMKALKNHNKKVKINEILQPDIDQQI